MVPEGGRAPDRIARGLDGGDEDASSATTPTPPISQKVDKSGALDLLTLEYLTGAGACALGTPEECLEACRRYEAAGVDLLLCLVNPYKIPHEKVMQTIELMGAARDPEVRRLRSAMDQL